MTNASRTFMRTSPRRGFSLVELLVVIGIIALLVMLTLPAVNSAIESGRRNQCQANQSKLALAMARFNALKECMPGLRNDITTAGSPSTPGFPSGYQGNVNWFIASLPYLGRQDVYDGIVAGTVYSVMNIGVTASGFDELNALTRCPSTAVQKGYRDFGMQYMANAGAPTFGSVTPAVSNPSFPRYSGGNRLVLTSLNRNDGAIGDNASYDQLTLNNPPTQPVRNSLCNPMTLDDIRRGDGQANTLLISETILRRNGDGMFWDRMWPPPIMDRLLLNGTNVPVNHPGGLLAAGNWVRRVPANVNDLHVGLVFGFRNITVTATTLIINAGAAGLDYPSVPGGGDGLALPLSRHVGGCFAAFVDGSTRFLKSDLPAHVYGHLVTSRSVYDASGPTNQKYVTNSVLANRYLAAPSYIGPPPYVLQPADY